MNTNTEVQECKSVVVLHKVDDDTYYHSRYIGENKILVWSTDSFLGDGYLYGLPSIYTYDPTEEYPWGHNYQLNGLEDPEYEDPEYITTILNSLREIFLHHNLWPDIKIKKKFKNKAK